MNFVKVHAQNEKNQPARTGFFRNLLKIKEL
jgi:hypothetical protein